VVSTARLFLRPWQSEDLPAFAAMNADPRVMERLGMTHAPADDFDHPNLPEGHHLRRHVLYRLSRQAWEGDREKA
jgi:RimJ/RimL family protein N-acetyltransferase